MNKRNWTREELILAFNLYLKIPFGKMHKGNTDVINLAKIISRTPSSVAMRLTNYASIDPYHQQRGIEGLPGGAKQCQPIWNEFIDNREELIFESERILAEWEQNSLENKYVDLFSGIENLKGETKLREVKTRINQNVFRQIVLANYSSKCAITGIDIPDFLVASHIIPWSKNESERLNPENGICFSALYDKAFDKGFIGINEQFEIIISSELRKKHKEEYYSKHFATVNKTKIHLPQKYYPKKEFLQFHMNTIFKGEIC